LEIYFRAAAKAKAKAKAKANPEAKVKANAKTFANICKKDIDWPELHIQLGPHAHNHTHAHICTYM